MSIGVSASSHRHAPVDVVSGLSIRSQTIGGFSTAPVTPVLFEASILSTLQRGWRSTPCCAVQRGNHGGGVLPQPHSWPRFRRINPHCSRIHARRWFHECAGGFGSTPGAGGGADLSRFTRLVRLGRRMARLGRSYRAAPRRQQRKRVRTETTWARCRLDSSAAVELASKVWAGRGVQTDSDQP